MLAPVGGVATGWQLVLRSRNVSGPYEEKIVLAQGATEINGPHQGALVDTASGEWWFIHFQDVGLYGRVVHLQPVHWQNGWPMMGVTGADGVGEPVVDHRKPGVPATARIEGPPPSDEFTSSKLGLQWQWHANHHNDWYSLTARAGWLRLGLQTGAKGGLGKTPHLLLQKFPARSFMVDTQVELSGSATGDEAGLTIVGRESAALAIARASDGYE